MGKGYHLINSWKRIKKKNQTFEKHRVLYTEYRTWRHTRVNGSHGIRHNRDDNESRKTS